MPTLEGATTLTVPAGTQHGTPFRSPDQGLPNLRSKKRGDLIVITQLIVPRKLSEAQRKLLADYAKTENLDVRPVRPSFWGKIRDAMTPG